MKFDRDIINTEQKPLMVSTHLSEKNYYYLLTSVSHKYLFWLLSIRAKTSDQRIKLFEHLSECMTRNTTTITFSNFVRLLVSEILPSNNLWRVRPTINFLFPRVHNCQRDIDFPNPLLFGLAHLCSRLDQSK